MLGLIWAQLVHRGSRTVALLLGIAVATTSFTVLTGTTQTSQLRVLGTVHDNARGAYDILVRPQHSQTEIETRRGLVRANYLSGIFGGITLAQYKQVKQVSDVEVAAPVANVGYVLQTGVMPVDLSRGVAAGERSVLRVSKTWVTDRGLTRIPDAPDYLYATPAGLDRSADNSFTAGPVEVLDSGKTVHVCALSLPDPPVAGGPFGSPARSQLSCHSQPDGTGAINYNVRVQFAFFIAAIDPVQEAKLTGLDTAVVAGRYLRAGDAPTDTVAPPGQGAGVGGPAVPVLVAARPYVDEQVEVATTRLGPEAVRAVGNAPSRQTIAVLNGLSGRPAPADGDPGQPVLREKIDAATVYQQLLTRLAPGAPEAGLVDTYWSTGATSYAPGPDDAVTARPAKLPPSVWASKFMATGYVEAPMTAADTAFRPLTAHVGTSQVTGTDQIPLPALAPVGHFDPEKLPGFSALSAVPLETYNPPVARGGDDRSRQLLGGRSLLPKNDPAGYLLPPPTLLTTLDSLPAFDDPAAFTGTGTGGDAPISVIRVRVGGVTGVDPVSRERVRRVAEEITRRTGLAVDITLGSSPTATAVALPSGQYGRPELLLEEPWVRKGVAVAIIDAVDHKSLVLFVLILAVCALFVANAASSAVRSRRAELGVLACLGWPKRWIFAALLGEMAVIGTAAGVLAAAAAVPLAAALGVDTGWRRLAIAVPAALLLALLAGAVPAFRAAGIDPGAAVRPPIALGSKAGHSRGVAGLALANLRRVPGRSLLGAASLAIGICALTLLLAVTYAFGGVLTGSLLGEAVSAQIRGVDVIAITATVLLGVLSVADVLYLSIRDRAAELATLRATGWSEAALRRLVGWEAVGIGVIGSVVGAATGLAAAAAFATGLSLALWTTAAAAAAAGVVLAALASVVPAALLRRLPTAPLLAQE